MLSNMKKVGWLVLLVVSLVIWIPFGVFGDSSNSIDVTYNGFGQTVKVLQPKNWTVEEEEYVALSGDQVKQIILVDRAEKLSRKTKFVFVGYSTASTIFSVPSSTISRLTEKDLVNYYVDQAMRFSIGGQFVSGKIKQRAGMTIYSVEWSYLSREKLKYVQIENFIFDKKKVYHLSGKYVAFNPSLRGIVEETLDSFIISQ